ncbi:TPA: hypothetical protein R4341_001154 [Pasteurella multocida]|nr:hypothetical protein [Pasteurella multocida]HED4463495.1 hypothetical protein [Pasteurella multocida]HED4475294.1 hypothetical protein [Pasteurella multocida]
MTRQKLLPKKTYSLEKAAEYISINYGLKVDKYDLFQHIQDGQLTASIYIEGSKKSLKTITGKSVSFEIFDEKSYIKVLDASKLIAITEHCFGNNALDPTNNFSFSVCMYSFCRKSTNIFFKECCTAVFSGYFNIPIFYLKNSKCIFNCGYSELYSDNADLLLNIGFFHDEFEIDMNDIYILHSNLIKFLNSFDLINTSDITNYTAQLLKEMEEKNRDVSGKSLTSYLNIIQALKDELIEKGKFENQTEIIELLSCKYQGYIGLTESNLRDKFAKANNIK